MVKRLTTALSLVLTVAAVSPAAAQKRGHTSGTTSVKPALKFLDAIEVKSAGEAPDSLSKLTFQEPNLTQPLTVTEMPAFETNAVEKASAVQLKYALLLDTEVEQILDTQLFSAIDEWYGTRYQLGGSTKEGIDCSAFIQVLYSQLFQIPMPRTAKEQYGAMQPVSRTELKEGDLVFFNTHGSGVTHVGMYLQNNKFVHAATSGGVMISDLSDAYWVKHFFGAGRYQKETELPTLSVKP